MKKSLCYLVFLALCVLPGQAQYTQVAATSLSVGSVLISNGTVCAVAVDINDNPINVAIGSNLGIQGAGQSCGNIVGGAITTALGGGSYLLADAALAGNPGFTYDFVVTDTNSKQSFTLHQVPNVQGSTYILDHYFPTITVPTANSFTFTTGSGAPSMACSVKSLYQDISASSAPVLYQCGSDLAFHVIAGGGGGSFVPPGTTNDITFHGAGSTAAADSGNLTNDPVNHNFHQKQVNNIKFASQYQTGAGHNGILNALGSTTGQVIINDVGNTGDSTLLGMPQKSTVYDFSPGSLGVRSHNCVPNSFIFPVEGVSSVCISDFYLEDTTVNANGTNGYPFRGLNTLITGYGRNTANLIGSISADQGWALDSVLNVQGLHFRNGISNLFQLVGDKHSNGDFQDAYLRFWCFGGQTDISGEGCNGLSIQGGQKNHYPVGTVSLTTGTGDQDPLMSFGNVPMNAGSMLVDTQTAKVSGTITAVGGSGWSGSTYLNLLPVTGTFTASTASCTSLVNVPASTIIGTPQSQTFTCTVGSLGAIAPGTIAQFASQATPEQVMVTAASAPVAGVQTITILSSLPHVPGSNLIQGGPYGCLSEDANLSIINWRTAHRIFGAADSSHLIYGFLIHGRMTGVIPSIGNEPETVTTPNNGYHIYPCAEIEAITNSTLGTSIALEQNDVAWHNGDTAEDPQNPAVNMYGLTEDVATLGPSNGGGSGALHIQGGGPGWTSNFFPVSITNTTNPSQYLYRGGWASAPDALTFSGDFRFGLTFNTPPEQAMINVFDSPTSPAYEFLQTNGPAGNIYIEQLNSRIYFTGGVGVAGLLTAPTLGPSATVVWTTGTSDPTGSCGSGAMFTNSTGVLNHTLFVCIAGAWLDVK